ncbi:hypothetical protein [Glaciecola petra]|uniref:CARDB domain-containing protein n=1 Tax=Glaciecola petra TaxID=3075602 RepID=A0ABU2ZTU1_9ALTE|nr:hypothetical protein [Aestuariibacter sp. P117]MDT0596056.1 hypothetical protein [Aestuariibacter sp. P117]
MSDKSNNLISYIAVGLSVFALVISIVEVTFTRDELRSQAWPYIEIENAYSADGFTMTVSNKGVGPAKVRSLTLILDNKPIQNFDEAILKTVGTENAFSFDVYKSSNPSPGVMSSNESITLFRVPWESRTELLLEKWRDRFRVQICYCSIFEDCWLSDTSEVEPKEVSACPAV